MERRDLIKDELERIGKAISQLLANFLALKTNGNIAMAIENTNKQLKEELDIDVELMLTLQQQVFAEYLESKKLTPQHIEILIDYFFETGSSLKDFHQERARIILNKALEMIDFINNNSKTYSFERKGKEDKIRELIRTLKN
ncbi:MAG: hypothetical protein KFKLKKLM_02279 [Flavobacteriales bacterium]|nr:hypothetical protein [Flavobacteriales bacterium]